MEATKFITLRGVRVHNLQSIDVDIPVNRLTVVTGISGAGKSSLVFDTLYAEAQRRYLQTFSTWTRQYLERFDQPDADDLGDLPPAIAIRGHRSGSPRTTVETLTDLGDDLRILFARYGTITCPRCKQIVRAYQPGDVLAAVQSIPVGTRCTIAFAIFPLPETDWDEALLEEGYVRVQVGDRIHRLGDEPTPPIVPGERVWVLLDRIEVGKTPSERLTESIELAFRRGDGRVGVLTAAQQHVFDQRPICTGCGRVFREAHPRLFDSNDPLGACPACGGTGLVNEETCPACHGDRFNAEALAVMLFDHTIADWTTQPLATLLAWTNAFTVPDPGRLEQMRQRLQLLDSLGLNHLMLAETASDISDGEMRRISLASALASNLVHVLYLIDEPTLGLDAPRHERIVAGLHRLRDRGNTVIVIDHGRDVLAAADHVIDLGPGAGDEGGTVTYVGPPAGLASAPESPTSDFWTGRRSIETPARKRKPIGSLLLSDIELPLGTLCAVTGIGATQLLEKRLFPLLHDKKAFIKISGAHKLHDAVLLDQRVPARSSRSNPATYLKAFDEIRNVFAETTDARIRNFGPGHFSFNQPGGRCETCEGQGILTIDMQFLADVVSTCPECQGRRFRGDVLEIKVRSLNIAEILDLTIREAFRFFRAQPRIEKKLKWLLDVGLDYLRLGQSMETLSGSECQRLKLAAHLATTRKPGVLYLLTDPSAGLHPADIENLLECFDRLLAAGHSLIIADSDADLLRCADAVIEVNERPAHRSRSRETSGSTPAATE